MGDDDIDSADWLSSQFGEEEPPRRRAPVTPPPLVPPTPQRPRQAPDLPAAVPPAEQVPPPVEPGGFSWGLVPGGGAAEPASPPQPTTAAPPEPAAQDWDTPTVASPVLPTWDTPTVASPTVPAPPQPIVPAPPQPQPTEVLRQEFPGFGVPVDPGLGGATEVLGAQPVGTPGPDAEGPKTSAIDSLFGDAAFVEYGDEPIIPPRPSSTVAVVARPASPTRGREGVSRTQRILLSVAGGLVAALALVALFLAGTRIAQSQSAALVPSPSPSATQETTTPGTGPVAAGDHNWSELLGGECITPFETAWADTFTVVDCTQSHQAQMVYTSTFDDAPDVAYPGVEALQSRMTALCTAPTVIDYAAIGGATDILVSASFAADEQDWADGNRTFYCFVSRANGAEFTTSVAIPQAAVETSGTPAP